MALAEPLRGDVWLADLDKRRPVVVLTRDPLGRMLNAVIVGPVTSTVRGLSTEVPVGADDGVRHPSVINLDHIQLVARQRLARKVGVARTETMRAVCTAIDVAVGCDQR